ncbi:MAG: hypothetical protein JWN33_457 [Candidatus Saccharibacteria bacterium]|nr:hypothetical protein [Candidatus Saccharibacteria bacterium]
MSIITDEEFGKITIRRSARATQVRIRVAPDGTLRASLPLYAPLWVVKRLIKSSRDQLRSLIKASRPSLKVEDGMRIGKSHSLLVTRTHGEKSKVSRTKQHIIVELAGHDELTDGHIEKEVRDMIIDTLRKEAKSYLPRRLQYLADQMGMHYERVRFSHASSRWGSCSSTGTISLNIALMKLPFELIDYVIVHELAHTQHMDHSKAFWQLVLAMDPHYIQHRRLLGKETPSI